MKKLIMTLALAAIGFTASAQLDFDMEIFHRPLVPEEVKSKFAALYSDAERVQWEMEDDNYKAEFKQDGLETEVIFDKNGDLVRAEEEISTAALPESAVQYLEVAYPGKKIKEASCITDENGNVRYEAEVRRDDLLFDAEGNYLGEG